MKKTLKRSLSIILAIAIVFSSAYVGLGEVDFSGLFAFKAKAAEDSGTCGENLTWKLSGGHLIISGTGDMPDWSGSYSSPWHKYANGSITSVEIEDGVTSIGDYAFWYCEVLTSVTIPASVTKIGFYAFHNCKRLNKIYFPDTVTTIDGCPLLGTAFRNNSNNWENGLLYCGKHLVDATSGLSGSLTIKSGTISIADSVFYGSQGSFDGLTSVTFPNSLKYIGSKAFYNCIGLTSLTISGNIQSIGENAFYGCAGLTSIKLSDSVIAIGRQAFYGTGYYNDSTKWIDGVLYIGKHLIAANPDLVSGTYAIKSGTLSIAENAFSSCSNLTNITIPNSVASIGARAFSYCSGLTSITIPAGIRKINDYTFSDCSGLTSITIPDGVVSIGSAAFDYCTGLKSINIPASVTILGKNSFRQCNNLERVDITDVGAWCEIDTSSGGPLEKGADLYINGELATDIVIPAGTSKIGDYAFCYCSSIKSVTIPDSVKSIGVAAFAGCTALTEITIPDSVTNIAASAFRECTSFTSITIPDGVTSIKYNTFNGCTSLASITIPDSVTDIASYAFYGCTSLTSIVIPDGIIQINEYTFYNCSALKTVTIPVSLKEVKSDAFDECKNISYVFYTGSYNEWSNISFNYRNTYLTNAKRHYNATDHTYSTEWAVDVVPTCTRNGSKSRHCTACDAKIDVINLEAFGHDYSTEWTVDTEPTCTENGSKSRHCNNCTGKIDVISIPALGHEFSTEWTVDVEPTCTNDGSKSRHCSICDDKTDITIISSFGGHYFENEICIKCNAGLESLFTSLIIKSGVLESAHTYSNNANETKTFTASGADYIEVVFSSSTEVENSYDKIYIYDGSGSLIGTYTGTTLANKTITVDGDTVKIKLTSDGSVTRYGYYATCSAYKETLLCNNHLNKKLVNKVEPDCKNNGYSGDKVCAVCEAVIEQGEVIPAIGHSCDEWTIDSEPNCTETGSKHGVCSTCGENTTEAIPATGHQTTEWITEQEPNCTEAGYKDEWCLDCFEIINTEEIPATGHLNTEWITELEPNCTEAGYKDEWCLDCGELINTEEIPELGHSYGDWIIDTEPTCTEDGSKHQICSVCNDVKTEAILSDGHSFSTEWTIDVEPDCTEEGSKSHHCTACEEITDITVVAPLGHTYSTEWTIDIKPTCIEEGSKSHHCIRCNNEKEDVTVVEPMGHNFSVISVANEHPHIVLSECSRCPETKEEESYSEKCGVCNFTYTENADGTCKITAYTGSSAYMVIPASIDGKTVATTNTGAFKNITTLTSVKIENGVQGIGSLAFLGCSSLSEVVIPESVTNIGSKAFYNCSSDLTIYCYSGSYAMQYAIDNGHNYVIIDIGETENTRIDYVNKIIFATDNKAATIDEIVYIPESSNVSVKASIEGGNKEIYGTGSIVTITDGDKTSEYTLIVDGDLNGDATCDVIDASVAYLYSVGLQEATENEILAANGCTSEELDASSYQNVVNMCLAS